MYFKMLQPYAAKKGQKQNHNELLRMKGMKQAYATQNLSLIFVV